MIFKVLLICSNQDWKMPF